jgi:6-pyruvoyltetrahydropterin/6-carboxytetrahydropterin synthase
MRVGVLDYIDSAHAVPGPDGPAGLHGHTYRVEVAVQGDHKGAMVVDFKVLKERLKAVLKPYDHCVLDEILPNPDVDGLAKAIFLDLAAVQEGLLEIKVWEGDTRCACVRGPEGLRP